MEKVIELRDCVDSIFKDAQKFFQKNNKAAGVRVRKKLQKCKELSQEIRIRIQKTKQENVQEKSAEISALAAANGGNTLTHEAFFEEETFIPPPDDLNIASFDQIENIPLCNLKEISNEKAFVPTEKSRNFLEKEHNQLNTFSETTFYPSFEE